MHDEINLVALPRFGLMCGKDLPLSFLELKASVVGLFQSCPPGLEHDESDPMGF